MGAVEIKLGLDEEAQQSLEKSIAVSEGHFATPYFALGILYAICSVGRPKPISPWSAGLELDWGSGWVKSC